MEASPRESLTKRSSEKLNSKSDLARPLGGSRTNIATAVATSAGPAPAQPQQQIVYENTYLMKPPRKFQSESVRKIADDILKSKLNGAKYDYAKVEEWIKSIADETLAAVKSNIFIIDGLELNYESYKYVVDVTIGEFNGQGIRVGSRCVWDTTTDSFASANFRNASIFAIVMVFGLYFE